MKAWRVYGINDLRLDDVPMPEVKPGWVLVRVRRLQPSITEVQQLLGVGGPGAALDKLTREKGPQLMLGHEFCGEVVELGEGVANVKVGDRVFYWRRVPCEDCALCRAGYEELCCKGPLMGLDIPGCLAEYVALPAGSIAAVPEAISDAEAATMQPLISIVGTCHDTGIEMGDTVVVIGQGSMGLSVTQIAHYLGAGRVIAVDVRDDILEFAGQHGADVTVNAGEVATVAAVMEATGGLGADIVFECAGGSTRHGLAGTKTLDQAFEIVRDQGKITQVAMLGAEATVAVSPINMRGIQYRGLGHGDQQTLRYTIELVASKRVQLLPLITHVLKGLEKVPEAFEITGNKAKYRNMNPAQVVVVE